MAVEFPEELAETGDRRDFGTVCEARDNAAAESVTVRHKTELIVPMRPDETGRDNGRPNTKPAQRARWYNHE